MDSQAHLAGFNGFLQADASAGYDGLYPSGVTEVACFAHFRRKMFGALAHPEPMLNAAYATPRAARIVLLKQLRHPLGSLPKAGRAFIDLLLANTLDKTVSIRSGPRLSGLA